MQDTIIKGTGNSHTLKTVANFMSLYPTYDAFAAALVAGTLPVDISALVAAGVQQQGTALNTANLLSATTATLLGLTGNPTPNDAFLTLNSAIKDNPYLWNGSKKLGSLSAGALVKLNENGQAKKFIVLDKDHYGPGTGVTLIRKDTFAPAGRSTGYFSYSQSIAENMYLGCILDNFCDGIWPLKLDEEIRKCIVPVPIVVAEGGGVTTLHTIYRKGFALSCTEVDQAQNYSSTEGTKFSYFSDNSKRIAYLDGTTKPVNWGLRSPSSAKASSNDPYYAFGYYIASSGTIPNNSDVFGPYFAPRPAFNLKSDMVISSSPGSDGCYTFVKKGGT